MQSFSFFCSAGQNCTGDKCLGWLSRTLMLLLQLLVMLTESCLPFVVRGDGEATRRAWLMPDNSLFVLSSNYPAAMHPRAHACTYRERGRLPCKALWYPVTSLLLCSGLFSSSTRLNITLALTLLSSRGWMMSTGRLTSGHLGVRRSRHSS